MTFQKSYAIPAKPAPVFDALTSERHLRVWFAEQVAVGAQPGDPFRFWGRHTLWVPAAEDAAQTLTRLEFPRALGFAWTWRGAPTEVTIEVAADAEGTRLELKQEFERPWPASDPDLGAARAARQERIVAAFWDVAIANLAYYLFEGEPLLLPDYGAAGEPVELSLRIEAPAQEVFSALTVPAKLDGWIADEAQVELEQDGVYRYGWSGPEGTPLGPTRVLAFRQNQHLRHDWTWPGEPPTEVRWEIEASGDEAVLVVRHHGFERALPAYPLAWCRALIALRAQCSNTVSF